MAVTSFTEPDLQRMLELASRSLLSAFGLVEPPSVPVLLESPGACFVTLTKGGELRGCIGSLEPRRSLGLDLIENARHAAFSDPRFPPVRKEELDRLELEVSVLTPSREMKVLTEQELMAELRPGIDGVIVEGEGYRATFLPSVWEQLDSPEAFVAALKRKAGMAPNFWSDGLRWFRYETLRVKGFLLPKQ
ncbi:MAG: AmmeMemoRadiSam system protein A [Oceanospirillales bacterium]|nr:AmmeMemoRadiSam system protein A [Oceanospirillales bacterium]